MKKIVTTLLVALMLLNTVALAAPEIGASGALEVFVKYGATGGDGSFDSPFGSVIEARDYIRQLKANGSYPEKGVEVNLRGGKYPMNETVFLGEEDSGTETGPVVYQAYGNEEVTFYGGAEISMKDFKKVTDKTTLDRLINDNARNNIVYVDLHDYGIDTYGDIMPTGYNSYPFYNFEGEQIEIRNKVSEWCGFTPRVSGTLFYVNDKSKTLARYPNDGEYLHVEEAIDGGTRSEEWVFISSTGSIVNNSGGEPLMAWEDVYGGTVKGPDVLGERMKRWGDATDIWTYGYWYFHWSDGSSSLKSYDAENSTFTMKWPNWNLTNNYNTGEGSWGDKGFQKGDEFYMFNILEELDIPGEWYLDRKDGKLYYWPEEGETSGTAVVTTMSDYMFEMNNASNIQFRKLNIKAHRGRPFFMKDTNNIKYELCNFNMIGFLAIGGLRCSGIHVLSCYFENLQEGGVSISAQSDDKLTPTNNLIENCWANKYGLSGRNGTHAFSVFGGVGDKIRHCRVHDNPGVGLNAVGYDCVSEYVEVYDILQMMADSGVWYDYQNFTEYGNVVRHCYVHDIVNNAGGQGLMGVYQDGGSSGMTVESCLFENFDGKAIFFNGGRDNVARHNIFVDSLMGGALTSIMAGSGEGYYGGTEEKKQQRWKGWIALNNNAEKSAVVYEKFPNLKTLYDDDPEEPKYNIIEDNVYSNCKIGGITLQPYSNFPQEKVMANNTFEDTLELKNLGFVNKTAGDLRIAEDSPIYEEIPDFVPIDFERVGIQTPQLAMRLGDDSLSMLIDSNIAYKGFSPMYIDKDNRKVVPIVIDQRTYLPIRFIGESLGGKVTFDDATGTATIALNGKNMVISSATGEITVDGQLVEGFNAIILENRLLVPVRAMEAMGEKVMWYEGGLVVVGDAQDLNDTYNDGNENRGLIEELIRRLD